MLNKILSSVFMVMAMVIVISCQQTPKTESQMENEYSGTVPGQQPLTPTYLNMSPSASPLMLLLL